MATRNSSRTREVHGIVHHSLIAGAFYQGLYPGGFSDSLTGIHVPGPRANVDDSNRREIINFIDIPEPVQLPHFKIVVEMSDGGKVRKEIEVDFNANDEQPVHEAFQLALSTEVIRLVPDDVMQERYPETWAARKEKYVWRDFNTKPQRAAADLFEEAESAGNYLRVAENHEKIAQAKAELEQRKRQMEITADDEPPKAKRPPKIAK